MKKKVNISLGVNLHREATIFARSRETDFSGLVADALREYMRARSQTVGAAIPLAPAEVEPSPLGEVPIFPEIVLKAYPLRNAPCPCGSGLKYKRCCEQVVGPVASHLTVPGGFQRMARLPRAKEMCPCGSDYHWEVCCKEFLPFVKRGEAP